MPRFLSGLLSIFLCYVAVYPIVAQESITLTLSHNHSESIKLKVVAEGTWFIEGVKEPAATENRKTSYTPTGEIIRLKGDIRELDCSSATLVAIDLSSSSKLQKLDCSLNEISTLELSTHKDLKRLDCYSNALTELSVEENSELTYLDCGRNKIQSISLSCHKLEEFNCGVNRISELDLSKCTALNTVMCHQNKINGDGMRRLIQQIPQCATDGGILVIIDTEASEEENICTKEQVSLLKQKLWDPYDWKGGYYEEYAGKESDEPTKTEKICIKTAKGVGEKIFMIIDGSSDISFTGIKEDPVIREDEATEYTITNPEITISGSQISLFTCTMEEIFEADFIQAPSLISLNIGGNDITTLDLSSQGALQMLHCGKNQLKELDLSSLVNLQSLNCVQNAIGSLDLSHNLKLNFLNCASNRLTELHIEGEMLTTLFCYGNEIKELDLTRCPHLERIEGFENRLETLDVSSSPDLELLYCGSNKLTAIDLSNNPKLKELGCGNNRIEKLDLSKQNELYLLYVTDNNLKTLILSPQATLLERIDCYHNQLDEESIDLLIPTLPAVSMENQAEIYLLDSSFGSEGNTPSADQIRMIQEKNWTVFDQNGEAPIILSNPLVKEPSFRYTFDAETGVLDLIGAGATSRFLLFDLQGQLLTTILTDEKGAGTACIPHMAEATKYIICGGGVSYIISPTKDPI